MFQMGQVERQPGGSGLERITDGALNRTGFPGGSNFQVEWSYDEQDDEQIQP